MLKKYFERFENFVFDMNGTIWRWSELVPGFAQVFQILENFGKNVYLFTDSTLLTKEGFVNKLKTFGIEMEKERIVTPSQVAVKLFQGKKVFCIGEGLITELRKANVKVTDSRADAVLIGMDRNVNYDKLRKACEMVLENVKLYKTSKNNVFFNGSRIMPNAGAIAKVVEATTGKKAELIGAPSKYMVKEFEELNLEPEKTVLFGDECDTDIALGNVLGYTTVLVTTGKDGEADYLKARGINEPKLVMKSVKGILK